MSSSLQLTRGDIVWVDLDPVRGSEIAKTRPCVVLSKTTINQRRNTVVIMPLTTSQTPVGFPLIVSTPSAGTGSKARIEHVRSVDKSRIKAYKGFISNTDIAAIEAALKDVLVFD
jgi:mRNA interferase MazF